MPGEGDLTKHAKEVSFQLVSMNKSFVSKPMYAVTTPSVGNPSFPMAKLTALGWILRGAFGVSRQLFTASAFGVQANKQEMFDLQTIYESLTLDFEKFWSGENVGISKTKAKLTKLTALEIRAEEHYRKTAKLIAGAPAEHGALPERPVPPVPLGAPVWLEAPVRPVWLEVPVRPVPLGPFPLGQLAGRGVYDELKK